MSGVQLIEPTLTTPVAPPPAAPAAPPPHLDDMVRLPKDTSDPAWATVYERLGVPKDAAGYDLSAVKGSPEFIEHVRAVAVAHKMTPAQATAFATAQLAFQERQAATAAEAQRAANGAAEAELRTAWGAEYDVNKFRATKAAEQLGLDAAALDAVGRTIGATKLMEQLRVLGSRMGEAELLRGGTTPTGGAGMPTYTQPEAIARLTSLKDDTAPGGWASRFAAGEAKAIEEAMHLNRIIVGQPR